MGIKRNYHLSQRLIAYILFISLFLQSCGGGLQNQIVPQGRKQPSRNLELSDNPLANTDQAIVTSGGYLASFYEEDGELKADLKAYEKQPKPNYKGIPVIVEEGMELASLSKLDPTTQKSRIELNRSQSGQLSHITIRQGGLSGGMKKSVTKKGDEEKEKEPIGQGELEEEKKRGRTLELESIIQKWPGGETTLSMLKSTGDSLDLSNCELTGEQFGILLEHPRCKEIQTLNLYDNKIGDQGAEALAKVLPSTKIEALYLIMWDGKKPSPLGEHFSILRAWIIEKERIVSMI